MQKHACQREHFDRLHQWEQVNFAYTALILMLIFSPAPSVDCNWDGKLWVTCLCMSFLKSSYSGANFSLTRHAGHTLKYTDCTLLCTNKALSSPHLHYLHTHTHTSSTKHLYHCSALKIAPPGAQSKFAFHTGSWPKQINQPHAS